MSEVDLGPVSIQLAAIPTGAGQETATGQVEIDLIDDENDPRLNSLRKPTNLPTGVTFADASVIRSPVQLMMATYHDNASGKGVILVQAPLSGLVASSEGKPTFFAPGVGIEAIEISGRNGARVTISQSPAWLGSRHSLVWVDGDTVFQLNGRSTSDEELLAIAGSL